MHNEARAAQINPHLNYLSRIAYMNTLRLSKASHAIAAALRGKQPAVEEALGDVTMKAKDREHGKFAIVATGSLGRLDKGFSSDVELIILHKTLSEGMVRAIGEVIGGLGLMPGNLSLLPRMPEGKSLRGKWEMSFTRTQRQPRPQRIMDMAFVFGEQAYLQEARVRLHREWFATEMDPHFGLPMPIVAKAVKAQQTRWFDAMRLGALVEETGEIVNYDLTRGIAYFYDDMEGGRNPRSFKYGPLRFIQTALTYDIIAAAVVGGEEKFGLFQEIIQGMPTPIAERLDFLFQRGMLTLSAGQVEFVKECYGYFLALCHQSESLAGAGVRAIAFNGPEAAERIENLAGLMDSRIVKSL